MKPSALPILQRWILLLPLLLGPWLCPPPAGALTLQELLEEPDLTPEAFIRKFAGFAFRLGEAVQKAEAFLQAQAGDCDDFAMLAYEVFKARGYAPKVVAVFMDREVHVVCYLPEARVFLDYNFRSRPVPLQRTDGSLEDIARQVSASFAAPWRSASEIVYQNGRPKFLDTTFH